MNSANQNLPLHLVMPAAAQDAAAHHVLAHGVSDKTHHHGVALFHRFIDIQAFYRQTVLHIGTLDGQFDFGVARHHDRPWNHFPLLHQQLDPLIGRPGKRRLAAPCQPQQANQPYFAAYPFCPAPPCPFSMRKTRGAQGRRTWCAQVLQPFLPRAHLHRAPTGERSGKAEFLNPTEVPIIQPQGTEEVHPDILLVNRARQGDVQAFEQLVKQYDRQVFRIAQHITQNREDAEDVVQDAFLKAYEKLDQFQGNSKFYTWLVRIAVNESLMRLRKRRTGRMVSIDEDVETEEGSMPRDLAEWRPDPEMMYGQSELAEILRKTIQGLPPGFRVVFVLRDVEGLSTEETAETLGLSVPAVKSRLLRARLQLRERLSRYFRKNEDGTK
jgi:RNA polymerase sigma-70 factor (ECF subfamily)